MTDSRLLSPRFSALCAFILLAALARLIPHPPNFAPVAALTALALFAAFMTQVGLESIDVANPVILGGLLAEQKRGAKYKRRGKSEAQKHGGMSCDDSKREQSRSYPYACQSSLDYSRFITQKRGAERIDSKRWLHLRCR